MSRRRIIAVVPDLFFATRIAETASRLGVDLVQTPIDTAHATIHEAPPDLVILDLTAPGAVVLARALKADPGTRERPLVGFYPHVDRALREDAIAAGVDKVMPRSAFTTRLAELLQGGLSSGGAGC